MRIPFKRKADLDKNPQKRYTNGILIKRNQRSGVVTGGDAYREPRRWKAAAKKYSSEFGEWTCEGGFERAERALVEDDGACFRYQGINEVGV